MEEVKKPKLGRPTKENERAVPATASERAKAYRDRMSKQGCAAITVRFKDPKLLKKLDEFASKSNLSRSAAAEHILMTFLDNY